VPIIVEILSSKRLATAAETDSAQESLACWYSFPNRQRHRTAGVPDKLHE